MNLNLIGVVAFSAGVILVYAAIKKVDPRQVIKDALQGKAGSQRAARTAGQGAGQAAATGAAATVGGAVPTNFVGGIFQ